MDRLATLTDRIGQVCESHADGRIDGPAFLEQCTRLVTSDIGCARTGIWKFVELAAGTRALRCLAMYDAASDRMVPVPDSHDVGAYFLALSHTGYVNACDAGSHFATAGPFAERLSARHIHSLLAASLAVNGKVLGALTCTEVDRKTEWSGRQVNAVRRTAGRIAVSLWAEHKA